MLAYLWSTYGFEILFWLSVVFLATMFVVNNLTFQKGTYTDHTPLIKRLLSHPEHRESQRSSLKASGPTQGKRRGPAESKGELECRAVAERLTRRPFPKARPAFLQNYVTSGHNLELDCYNADLGIGIEYNGRQHYHYTPYFHTSKEAFDNTRYRDDLKRRLCDQAGIRLIVVPYNIKDIKSYLEDRLLSILT